MNPSHKNPYLMSVYSRIYYCCIVMLDISLAPIKNWYWTPSFTELLIYLLLWTLIFVLAVLLHYTSIQQAVRRDSRCLRAKQLGRAGGQYTVQASNKTNQPLYQVGYDLTAKEFTLNCACKEGKVVNTFRNIPVYNMKTQSSDTVKEKLCACDQLYFNSGDSVYYSGYPGLVSFMNSGDQNFFNSALSN